MRSYLVSIPIIFVYCFSFLVLAACSPEQESGVSVTPPTRVATTIPSATATPAAETTPEIEPTPQPTVTAATIQAATNMPQAETTTEVTPTPVSMQPLPVREEVSLTLATHLGGAVNAVALDGHIAYAAIGPRLVTIDIGEPAAPRLLGQSELLPGIVQAVAIQNSLAYVAAEGDLYLFDVGNPANPVSISTLHRFANPEQVSWASIIPAGDIVYTLHFAYEPNHFSQHLLAFDIHDPAQPVLVGTRDLIPYTAVAASEGVVYIAGKGNLQLLDATLNATLGETTLELSDQHGPYLLTVADDRAYIGTSPFDDQPLLVLDVSNPAQPVAMTTSSFNLPSLSQEMATNDGTLFLKAALSLHGGCPSHLHVMDITNATSPRYLTELDPESCIKDIAVSGTTLAAASGSKLQLFDASDPANLRVVGEYIHSDGFHSVNKIALNQDVAYLFAGEGTPGEEEVRILDISQTAAPKLTDAALDWGAQHEPGVGGLYTRGNRLILLVQAYLIAWDISEPAAPRLITPAEEEIAYWPPVPAAVGYILYAPVDGGLGVVDLSDPANPVLVNTISQPSCGVPLTDSISMLDVYLITVRCEGAEITLYDIGDPLQPTEVSQIRLPEPVGGFIGVGDTVYTAAVNNPILYAVDVSDPMQPAEVGRYALPFQISEMIAAEERLYLSTSDGVWVLNVSDKMQPYLESRFPYAGNLSVKGDWLYIAAGDAGLFILSLSGSTACASDSEFVRDVNVPDGTHFAPGTPFTKTWRIRNSGSCPWDASYQLNFVSGERMDGPERMMISEKSNQVKRWTFR